MLSKLKAAGLAAAMLAVPVGASATTFVSPGGSYDLLADDYFFNGQFAIGDAGDTYTFSFTNTSSGSIFANVGATVQQVSAAFAGGVSFLWGGEGPFTIAQDDTDGFESEVRVAAGETIDLILTFGNVIDTGRRTGGTADIDFAVEAAVIPVPAAGLLLLTAVGGLALARRRKTAA